MTNVFSPISGWTAASRHTATAHGHLMLGNTGGHDIRWARTADDTTPPFAPGRGHLLRPGDSLVIAAKPGDRIWLAAATGGTVVIDTLP